METISCDKTSAQIISERGQLTLCTNSQLCLWLFVSWLHDFLRVFLLLFIWWFRRYSPALIHVNWIRSSGYISNINRAEDTHNRALLQRNWLAVSVTACKTPLSKSPHDVARFDCGGPMKTGSDTEWIDPLCHLQLKPQTSTTTQHDLKLKRTETRIRMSTEPPFYPDSLSQVPYCWKGARMVGDEGGRGGGGGKDYNVCIPTMSGEGSR